MPARTNEFQKLVSLVQQALAPLGAKVTDSHLVEVRGMPREIDALIDSTVGPYRMKIAVEAKHHKRKLDMVNFEAIVGKYFVEGGVKVNKVVVVTHNGFTQPVIERAKAIDVELMTLKEAKDAKWTAFPAPPWPFKTGLRISDLELTPQIQDLTAEVVLHEAHITCSHGRVFGRPEQLAAYLFMAVAWPHNKAAPTEVDVDAANKPDGRKVKVAWKADHPHFVHVRGQQLPLESLTFVVHFSSANPLPQPTAGTFSFNFPPHVCAVKIEPPIEGATAKEVRREGELLCGCCGKSAGTIDEWANRVLVEHVMATKPEVVKGLYEATQKSPTGDAHIEVGYRPEGKWLVRFGGKDSPINAIAIDVHAVRAVAPIQFKQARARIHPRCNNGAHLIRRNGGREKV